MTRSGGREEFWGTREELLLACAVSRHGTQSWDSVAMEVQTRSPFSLVLDPQTCKRRYHALQRRFTAEERGIGVGDAAGGVGSSAIPLLEELRKLRVAELRREVESYDVSITSLQHKVKKLKEDRERSLEEEQSGEGKPDPPETDGREGEPVVPSTLPENQAVDRVCGGDSGRSFNESNSSEAKDGKHGAVSVSEENGVGKIDPLTGDEDKVGGEVSYDGSSDTVARETEVAVPDGGPGVTHQPDAGESGESVAESKGEAAVKENSDVQSSASLSRRRRGRRKSVRGGSRSRVRGDEAEADEVSPGNTLNLAESQPLVSFLEIFRSHEYGSVFERRLKIQESSRYRSMIRQHMEVAMVQRKLMEGGYAVDVEFYRDLLLLCTNAIIFFPKTAMEFVAAVELRSVVRKQIAAAIHRSSSSSSAEEPITIHQTVISPNTESDPDLPVAPPLVACRKRSSIAKEASKTAAAVEEEKPPDSQKKEAEIMNTSRTRERSVVAGLRRLRTNKGRGGSNGETRNSISRSAALHSTEDDGSEKPAKTERSIDNGVAVVKRRSAMNNLSTRTTERRHASSNGTLLETLKNSRKSLGSDPKKEVRGDEGRRDQGSRHASGSPSSSSGKQAQEQTVPVKRGVGRPPKRPPPPLTPPPAKRPRGAQTEAPPARAASGRKRGRKK
ncbi:unnamed protein product [Spirodela intermedia]|uniref:Bromo domain-containing protein n=1 Tax=Spirodela intermedia TaxID=51605 RepID=A0A7I8IVE4_SPIIN|nr:unnamed protein product [Spirodela intermedia]CAA6661602.1 unnamed protein product [Spirodela intermedia]